MICNGKKMTMTMTRAQGGRVNLEKMNTDSQRNKKDKYTDSNARSKHGKGEYCLVKTTKDNDKDNNVR